METTEIPDKAPEVKIDGEVFEIFEQDHKANGMIQLKYKAPSGRTAMVLLRKDGTYDEYIYEQNGELKSYDNKKL